MRKIIFKRTTECPIITHLSSTANFIVVFNPPKFPPTSIILNERDQFGIKNKKDKISDDDDDIEIDKKSSSNSEIDINNLIPRVDISNQITEGLLNELSDKNWKVDIIFYDI